mmetsp:Transcript_4791/g.11656  ORF Transcript_4791/g.11656 Transcript_4791/m.11656 type:complete len:100 (-) Transcript_4791:583-882(-)
MRRGEVFYSAAFASDLERNCVGHTFVSPLSPVPPPAPLCIVCMGAAEHSAGSELRELGFPFPIEETQEKLLRIGQPHRLPNKPVSASPSRGVLDTTLHA